MRGRNSMLKNAPGIKYLDLIPGDLIFLSGFDLGEQMS